MTVFSAISGRSRQGLLTSALMMCDNQAVEPQQSVQSAYEALQEARGRVRLMDNCEKQFNKYKHQLTLN